MSLLRLVLIGLLLLVPCAVVTAQESEPEEKPAPTDFADESAKDGGQSSPDKKEEPDEAKPEDKEEPAKDDKPVEEKPKDEKSADEENPSKDEEKPAKNEKPKTEESSKLPTEIVPRNYLTLQSVGTYGKAAIHTDPIDYLLATGKWKYPADGDEVESSSGPKRKWAAKEASDEGVLDTSAIRGGYAVVEFDSPAERVMILRASGHAMVYVNGEPRTGDPYGYGWVELPILVRKGRNELMFQAASESLSAKLIEPTADVFFLSEDATIPNLVEGEPEAKWAAVPVVNATQNPFTGHIVSSAPNEPPVSSPLPTIPPLSVFKAPVKLPSLTPMAGAKVDIEIAVFAGPVPPETDDDKKEEATISTPEKLAATQITLESVAAGKLQSRTFRSAIDGSVQPYAVLPAGGDDPTWEGPPGIILSLHGESVDARKQAEFYEPKRWAHIVAPTNRRPFGFDWEDWGRIDALEALADAEKRFPNDPARRYATGHSMGGHGAWHLGVTYPGQIAAIGPSGGWPSYWSYGGGMPTYEKPTPVEEMLLRGNAPSDTMSLIRNLSPVGTYLLHGDQADERDVAVTQARFMRSRLGEFHPDFAYYEKPGAGHWWGKESVDWPWMMQFMREHKLPTAVGPAKIDFTTANPGVSSRCHWATIEMQEKQLQPSRVVLDQTPSQRKITGRTENVRRLMLDLGHFPPGGSAQVQLDGKNPVRVRLRGNDKRVWLVKQGDRWAQINAPAAQLKGPNRYGTFKSAFDNRVMLVYGTKGSDEENAWALAKARYDAETFWYRGNGAIEVVADTDFDPEHDTDCSVILFGNSETNAAWPTLMTPCPVQVRPGQVSVGMRPESGDDLAVVMCWPRQGSDNALVGFVGGTGIAGMRLTNRLRYFVAGVAYPDLMVFGPESLTDGTEDIRALGYFGNDWKVDSGEIVWRDVAL